MHFEAISGEFCKQIGVFIILYFQLFYTMPNIIEGIQTTSFKIGQLVAQGVGGVHAPPVWKVVGPWPPALPLFHYEYNISPCEYHSHIQSLSHNKYFSM